MLTVPTDKTVYVYTQPVDMRKAVNGLIVILQESFQKNPQSGDLYLFTNRQRNKIKALFWDNNGFVLYYKRIEKGRFNYSKYLHDQEIVVTQQQLKALLMGIDFHLLSQNATDHYAHFF